MLDDAILLLLSQVGTRGQADAGIEQFCRHIVVVVMRKVRGVLIERLEVHGFPYRPRFYEVSFQCFYEVLAVIVGI